MNRLYNIIILGALFMGLAACGSDTATEEAPAASEIEVTQLSEPAAAPEVEVSTTDTANAEIEAQCLSAVETETSVTGATVIEVSDSEAGTFVSIFVPGAQAPWNCVYGAEAENSVSVYYSGSEGDL